MEELKAALGGVDPTRGQNGKSRQSARDGGHGSQGDGPDGRACRGERAMVSTLTPGYAVLCWTEPEFLSLCKRYTHKIGTHRYVPNNVRL